jgi:hypothetical protein
MNIIKRNPVIYIIIVVSLVVFIASAATFSGTYSWFVKSLKSIDVEGKMGTVDVQVKEAVIDEDENENYFTFTGATVTNTNTDIPIIVRVRVIAEWVQDPDKNATGVPPSDATISIEPDDEEWILYEDEQEGIFLVYEGDNDFLIGEDKDEETGYGIVTPDTPSLSLPDIYIKDIHPGWIPTVTLIAEALQATEKAYQYTLDNAGDIAGVTSWEVTLP